MRQLRFRKSIGGVPRSHQERLDAVFTIIERCEGEGGVSVSRLAGLLMRRWGLTRRAVELILVELSESGYTFVGPDLMLHVNPERRRLLDSCLELTT